MKNVDWADIAAIFLSVFSATMLKHFLFTEKVLAYSIWTDLLVYMLFFLPIYLLLKLFLNRKKR